MPALTSEEFWQYSLSIYPKCQQLLLALQDRFGLNVNCMLMCGYMARQGLSLSLPVADHWRLSLSSIEKHVCSWRFQRRKLKRDQSASYAWWLKQELILERQQQRILVIESQRSAASDIEQACAKLALSNLRVYLQSHRPYLSCDTLISELSQLSERL